MSDSIRNPCKKIFRGSWTASVSCGRWLWMMHVNMTSDDLWSWYMTFDRINIWMFPYYGNKLSLVQIGLLNIRMTTWPQMISDLGIWPLITWTYEDSHTLSINQVWFQSDFIFSNEATFTFSAYLTTWPQMTLTNLDLITNEGSHVAYMTQLWLKSIRACGSWAQMWTCFNNNKQPQQ